MKYIKIYEIGNMKKYKLYPLEEYVDLIASQYGYDSYEEMEKDGLHIPLDEKDIIEKGDD